jgi:hypothetical protein
LEAAAAERPATGESNKFDFEMEVHGKKLSEADNYKKI